MLLFCDGLFWVALGVCFFWGLLGSICALVVFFVKMGRFGCFFWEGLEVIFLGIFFSFFNYFEYNWRFVF